MFWNTRFSGGKKIAMTNDMTVFERVIDGRYEEIAEVIDKLAEASFSNNGGKYSEVVSGKVLRQAQVLNIDPYAKAIVSVQYGVRFDLNEDKITAWRYDRR